MTHLLDDKKPHLYNYRVAMKSKAVNLNNFIWFVLLIKLVINDMPIFNDFHLNPNLTATSRMYFLIDLGFLFISFDTSK